MGSREFTLTFAILALLIVPIVSINGNSMKTRTWSASLIDLDLPSIKAIDPSPEDWCPDPFITFNVMTSIPWNLSGHFRYYCEISSDNNSTSEGNWIQICRKENIDDHTSLIKFITFDNSDESWIRIRIIDNHDNAEISPYYRIRPRPPFPIFKMVSHNSYEYYPDVQQEVRIRVEHGDRGEHPFTLEYRLTTRDLSHWTPWKVYDGQRGAFDTIINIEEIFRRGDQNYVQVRIINNEGRIERASTAFNIKINTYPEIIVMSPSPGDRLVEDKIIIFDATDSFDPDGDRLTISWFKSTPTGLESMGDSQQIKANLEPGEYTITVIAKDRVNNQVQKTFTITVEPRPVSDTLVDTDGDGMIDEWEIMFQTDPLVDDAQDDPDGDGFTNLQEYENCTNPRNRLSNPSCQLKDHYGQNESEMYGSHFSWFSILLIVLLSIISLSWRTRRSKS